MPTRELSVYRGCYHLFILKYCIMIMKKSILCERESYVDASMESFENGKQRDFEIVCNTIFEIICLDFHS